MKNVFLLTLINTKSSFICSKIVTFGVGDDRRMSIGQQNNRTKKVGATTELSQPSPQERRF